MFAPIFHGYLHWRPATAFMARSRRPASLSRSTGSRDEHIGAEGSRTSAPSRERAADNAGTAAASHLDPVWAERLPLLLVLLVMLMHAVALRTELVVDVPTRNDTMFHLLMVRGASEALANGQNPLDFWIPQLELGFPQFLYYQHLPHVVLAVVHRATFGLVSVDALFHAFRYVLLVGMPLTVLWSMRRLGFSLFASALGAAASVLFVSNNRMGLEYNSYVARGYGLFSQLVAIHLTFVTIATLWTTLREGRGHAAAAASLAALVLSHLLFGVIIAVMSTVLVLLGGERRELPTRALRLAVVGLIAAVVCSYMLIPFVQSSKAWLSTMPWLSQGNGQSARAASRLFTGALFDDGRLPVLTVLALAGLGLAFVVREARTRFVAGGLVICMLLYTLRPDNTWLGWLVPAHTGFVSYRFFSAVGVFAVLAIGITGDAVWRGVSKVAALRGTTGAALVTVASLLWLTPALVERWGYYQEQRDIIDETRRGITSANGLANVLAASDSIGGRVFAGPVKLRACPMHVGPGLCVSDLLNFRGRSTVGNPMQNLSLPSGLIHEIPTGDASVYDLFDVRAVVIESSRAVPAFFQPVVKSGDYALYRVATSGMAQYVGVNGRRATNRQDTLYFAQQAWLDAGGARTRQTTRWDYRSALQAPAMRPLCVQGPRTEREVVTSQSVAVDVRCDAVSRDTFAVALKMAFHPHWQVTVDGAPVTPYLVSPGFLAVDVAAGAHKIEARYRAHPLKLPLFLLGVAALVAAVLWRRVLDAPVRWIS